MVLRSSQVAKVNSQVKLLRVNVARSKHVAVKNSCREAVEVYLLDMLNLRSFRCTITDLSLRRDDG